MAQKAVISVPVDTAEFDKFVKAFNAYQEELDKQPEAWKKLNAAMAGAGDAGNALAGGALTAKEAIALAGAQAAIVAEALTEAVKAQDKLGDSSHSTNKKMSELAKTAKSLGGEVAGMGKWILRLGASALTGLGLGAVVGGFGIGELTNTLYQRGRAASGVGLSPGQLASFQAYGQQFLGEGALHAAASAQLSYQSAPYLQMLGIDFMKAQRMNAADLSFEMLKGAVRAWNDAQKSGLPPGSSPFVRAYEQLGGDLEDVRRAVMAGGVGAVAGAQGRYRAGAASMEYDMRPWADFKMQLDAAGRQIEAVFGRALSPLVPEFTQISKDLVEAFAAFAQTKTFKDLITDVQKGLEGFIVWIEGPEPKKLWDGLSLVGSEVMAVAEKLKWLLPQQQPVDPKKPPYPGMVWHKDQGAWVDPKSNDKYDPLTKRWYNSAGFNIDAIKWLKDHAGGAMHSAWDKIAPFLTGAAASYHPKNNPLDLSSGSDPLGNLMFYQYASTAEGIRAGAALLKTYPKNWGAKTIAQALPIWSGTTDNPNASAHDRAAAAEMRRAYISHVEQWSGVSANTNIADLTRAQLAAVIAAMSRQEGTDVVTPDQVMKALYGVTAAAAKKKRPLTTKQPTQIVISNSTASRVSIAGNGVAMG